MRRVSYRLRPVWQALVCAGTSGDAAAGLRLLAGVALLRHPGLRGDGGDGLRPGAGSQHLAAGSGGLWPAGGGDPAARLGTPGACERQRACCGALLHGGDEGGPLRDADHRALRGAAAAVARGAAAGDGHDHRLCRRTLCPDGAQHPAPAGVPHPGEHRHYSARPGGRGDRHRAAKPAAGGAGLYRRALSPGEPRPV